MEIFMWIVGLVVLYLVYAHFAGIRLQIRYQEVINDLMQQLAQDPARFFHPEFHWNPNNYIGEMQLAHLLLNRVATLALQRGVRSQTNANIIPSDIDTLPGVKRDFERLFMLANSIANDRH